MEIRTSSITTCPHHDSNSPLYFITKFAPTNDLREQQILSTSNTSVKVSAWLGMPELSWQLFGRYFRFLGWWWLTIGPWMEQGFRLVKASGLNWRSWGLISRLGLLISTLIGSPDETYLRRVVCMKSMMLKSDCSIDFGRAWLKTLRRSH
jgi:hypothetical protein